MTIPKSLINQAKIAESQVNFQATFNMALAAVDDPMRALYMELSSQAASESHNWLGTVPGFSEWTDQRKVKSLRAENITLVNKDFGNAIEIGRNDVLDDRLGVVMPRINQLAEKAALHYGQLAVEAMINGFVTTSEFGSAYDGAAFFSATHQDGGPIQSNTAGGAALSSAAYFAGRASMWSLTDDEGDPLGIKPDTLIVGPSQEELGLQLTEADLIASGGAGVTNVARRTANLMVSPRLVGAAASHWFLVSMASAARPLILQIREAIFSDFVTEGSELSWRSKKLLFGAQGRHVAGYGMWQTSYGSNA
jgi:phage major head subunit gpT-like protein